MLSSQQHRWGKQSQLGLLMLNWLQYICNSICLVKRLKALVKFTYLGGTGMFDCSLCNGSNCISGTSVAYRNKNEYEMRCSWRNYPIPCLQVTLIYLPANAGVSVWGSILNSFFNIWQTDYLSILICHRNNEDVNCIFWNTMHKRSFYLTNQTEIAIG